jgi:hypothetical protein
LVCLDLDPNYLSEPACASPVFYQSFDGTQRYANVEKLASSVEVAVEFCGRSHAAVISENIRVTFAHVLILGSL